MNASKLYMIIGVALVAIIVIVLLIPEEGEMAQTAETAEQIPPGHPDVPGMGGENAPGSGNVRTDFMAEFERLGDKIKAQPETDTSDVLVYARMLLDAHQAANALPLFERYVKAAPKNTAAMLDLSVAYFETRKQDKAEAITRRVLQVDPENTTAMYNLGALAAVREKKAEAREIWQQLIDSYPDSPDAERAREMMKQL